mmetsp:Transcript_19972/g.65050  ORF Transcript_19972/g.65050 Transcript_19972/m.65050 type:complete len:712 (-) Transcript_19972:1961-4096(-)
MVGFGPKSSPAKGAAATAKGRSVGLSYEVQLAELLAKAGCAGGTSKPDEKRLECHMLLVKELLGSGAFGALNGVMEAVVKELTVSLYTEKLTAVPGAGVERVPCFAELEDARREMKALKAHVALMQQQTEQAMATSEMALRELKGEGPAADRAAATIGHLEYQLERQRIDAEDFRERLDLEKKEHRKTLLTLEAEVSRWKQAAQDAQTESARLNGARLEQDSVRSAFAELQARAALGRLGKDGTGEEAAKLERQLLVLQNVRIDEYETDRAKAGASEQHLLTKAFAHELTLLQRELEALQRHLRSGGKYTVEDTRRPGTAAAPAPVPLVNVQASSDGGASYLAIAHGLRVGVVEVELPPFVTHVRLIPSSSTGVSRAATADEDAAAAAARAEALPYVPDAVASAGFTGGNPAALLRPDELAADAAELNTPADADADAEGAPRSSAIWDGFLARFRGDAAALEPPNPRKVTLESLLAIIAEVIKSKWDVEQHEFEETGSGDGRVRVTPLAAYFFEHLERVYVLEPVVKLVAHGVLTALDVNRNAHSVVTVFHNVLAGETDDSTWRYMMTLKNALAKKRPIASAHDFGECAAALYPDLREQDLNTLSHNFASHCTEPPSTEVAIEFLMRYFLSKDEPRLRKWLKLLKYKDTHHRGAFRRQDFLEITAKLFPAAPAGVIGVAFDDAARRHDTDYVPIESLARVACILDLSLVPK